MATKAEIRDRALRKLGVLATGQTPDANAASLATTAYDEIHAELSSLGLAVWAATADCPEKLSEHVANLIAYRLVNDFSVSSERYQRIVADSSRSESYIHRMINGEYIYAPVDYLDY